VGAWRGPGGGLEGPRPAFGPGAGGVAGRLLQSPWFGSDSLGPSLA